MSAKKGFETKLREDENTDSGFLSGELSGPCDSTELDSGVICDEKKLIDIDDDSGVTNITDRLVNVSVTVSAPPDQKQTDIPPLSILFQQDDDGDTQLHIASVHGCEKSVRTLVMVCPDKAWLDVPNDYGHTPLHLAVMSGNPVIAKMLVAAGASVGARDYKGDTPLHKATAAHQLECLRALLAHQPRKLPSSVLDQRNYNGQCAVHIAASASSIEALKILVEHGADINAREHLAGWTALHIAARRGDFKVVQYLREHCPGVVVRARDNAGRTPRRLARRTKAESAFANMKDDTDSESDSDDGGYNSDSESLFNKLRVSPSASSINVV